MDETIVSSWNEWDPLKHVIVGRAEGAMLQAPEPAVYRDFSKDLFVQYSMVTDDRSAGKIRD